MMDAWIVVEEGYWYDYANATIKSGALESSEYI
jgi:hypothetical protein